VALLGAAVAASLLWPEKPGGKTEEIGDGKMNPR